MRSRYFLGLLGIVVLGSLPHVSSGQTCIQQWAAPFPAGDLDGTVFAMAVYDDGSGPALYVGGTFDNARGLAVNKIAKWNGTSWSALGPGIASGSGVYALAVYNDGTGSALYVGGSFVDVGYGITANNIAKWNGSSWSRIGSSSIPSGTIGGPVWALATMADDPNDPNISGLYVGGTFTQAGNVANVNRIARWGKVSGGSPAWSALGAGMDNGVYALAVFDDDGPGTNRAALYAGGGFLTAGGSSARRIAKWSKVGQTMTWSFLPGTIEDGVNSTVWALAVYDDDGTGSNLPGLYVAGRFTTAGGAAAKKIACWRRSGTSMSWSAVGGGLDGGDAMALAVLDDDGSGSHPTSLYVGGNFTLAGSVAANGIAQWDGQSWSALGAGVTGLVRALGVYDDDAAGANTAGLFVGGDITTAGSWSVGSLARWSCVPIIIRRGDLNCDGIVNYADINPFVLRLGNPEAYAAAYPTCPDANADVNADGVVSYADINPFIALLGGR